MEVSQVDMTQDLQKVSSSNEFGISETEMMSKQKLPGVANKVEMEWGHENQNLVSLKKQK